jgi:DNA-binding GntR family transcriptional regulator
VTRPEILALDRGVKKYYKDGELAEGLGVSNTPVREAIRQLEKDGLVETIPHRGNFVKKMSPEEVCEIYDVRMVLEALAARLAVDMFTPEQLKWIETKVEEYERAFDNDDISLGLEVDFAFHDLIAQASGNKTLLEMLRGLATRIHALRHIDRGKTRRRESLKDHKAIYQALKKRDAKKAEEAITQHIRKGKEHVLSTLVEGRDLIS